MAMKVDEHCIFCKIIQGTIPCFKLVDTDQVLAFLDISPLSKGHALVIPKYHGAKLHDLPDSALNEILPTARNIAKALELEDYNILQNNGRIAHQVVDHVHFHIIPKPTKESGLGIQWPAQDADKSELAELAEKVKSSLSKL